MEWNLALIHAAFTTKFAFRWTREKKKELLKMKIPNYVKKNLILDR